MNVLPDEQVLEGYAFARFKLDKVMSGKVSIYSDPFPYKVFCERFMVNAFPNTCCRAVVEMLIVEGRLHRSYRFECSHCKTLNYSSDSSNQCGYCGNHTDSSVEMFSVDGDFVVEDEKMDYKDYSFFSKLKRFFRSLYA